jgi:hypothetical protein
MAKSRGKWEETVQDTGPEMVARSGATILSG